jgi:hypothetical protein
MKICSKCGESKEEGEFQKCLRNKDGLKYKCKQCCAIRDAKYRDDNRAIVNRRARDWVKNNSGHVGENLKRWRNENRFKKALQQSRVAANARCHVACTLTAEQLEATFTGKCALCGILETMCKSKLHLDHNHRTGAFRGWLCQKCNMMLGLANDNKNILQAAVQYLEDLT